MKLKLLLILRILKILLLHHMKLKYGYEPENSILAFIQVYELNLRSRLFKYSGWRRLRKDGVYLPVLCWKLFENTFSYILRKYLQNECAETSMEYEKMHACACSLMRMISLQQTRDTRRHIIQRNIITRKWNAAHVVYIARCGWNLMFRWLVMSLANNLQLSYTSHIYHTNTIDVFWDDTRLCWWNMEGSSSLLCLQIINKYVHLPCLCLHWTYSRIQYILCYFWICCNILACLGVRASNLIVRWSDRGFLSFNIMKVQFQIFSSLFLMLSTLEYWFRQASLKRGDPAHSSMPLGSVSHKRANFVYPHKYAGKIKQDCFPFL